MKLNDLINNEGAKKNRRRVGRGIAAGQGKTSGRGTKGQELKSWIRRTFVPPGWEPANLPPAAIPSG